MIYNMSVNEKVDFLSFFKYELQNGFKMTLKPKNNYIFLKHKLSAFQWYITCHDIRKLIFCHFLMYELQNGFKMSSKLKNNYRSLKHRLWAFKWYIICIGMKKLIFWCIPLLLLKARVNKTYLVADYSILSTMPSVTINLYIIVLLICFSYHTCAVTLQSQ